MSLCTKNLRAFILLVSIASTVSAATLTTVKSGKLGGDVRDLDFHNIAVGYAVGDDISYPTNNYIAKTTDGGQTWMNITPAQLTERPWTVEFAAGDTGFVGGYTGMLLRTTNAGQTWTNVNNSGYTGNIYDIKFAGNRVVYACGTNVSGTVLKSTDNGGTWTLLNIGNTTSRYTIFPFSDAEVVIAGASGSVARTTDGGTTWSTTTAGTSTLYSLARSGANELCVVNGTQALYKSTDRGATFSLVFDRGSSALYSLSMIAQQGIAVGSNGVNYRTTDGWATYDSMLVTNFTAQVCRAVYMRAATEIFVGADQGNILKSFDRGATWETVESSTRYYSLDFINANTGVAVGWRGTVIKTTNGGTTWTELRGLNGFELYDVQMFDANTFYACGGNGRFYVTTNGGTSFTERTLPVTTGGSAKTLHFLTPQNGYCSGEMGRIYKTTNAGVTWDSLFTFGTSSNNIEDVVFINANVGFALGERGRIVKTTNGTAWDSTGIVRPVLNTLWEAHFLNENTGYVAAANGAIYKTTNGGATWTKQNDTTALSGIDVIDIQVVDPNRRGFAVAEQGKLLRLQDANTWVVDRTITTSNGTLDNLWGIDFIDTTKAFISGYYGTIYKLDDGQPSGSTEQPIVKEFGLEQNYPNPFNPSTTISFSIKATSLATLRVYDYLGREVATLVNGLKQPGIHSVQWDATGIASGLYFYRLEAGNFVETKKMLLVR